MATFSVEFLGCKVSQTDAQALRERLAADGHVEVSGGEDVHVVNGCCVTHEALRKTAKAARHAARAGARVYVTGCAANLGRLGDLGDGIAVVPARSEDAPGLVAGRLGATGCVGPAPGLERTRAFLKVQDGCSFSCSFCVIPQVRGQSRSRQTAAILAEARKRVAAGHRELVVTGVNLGLFRDRQARIGLPDLLLQLAELDGVERVRLSSIEVNHLTEALCDALSHPRLCPHLHVPMQSGDDAVLRAMARRYGAEAFARKVERAAERIDGLNVTGDVIVGFPSEDAAAFENTLALVRRLRLSKVHVFPYSPRPGTVTAGEDPVPPAEKRRRSEALRALSDAQGRERRERMVGQRDRVLIERRDASGRLHGYGRDYTAYALEPAGAAVGDVVEVIGTAAGDAAVQGRIV
jgi:threonylcarbamoyladenosine tRNA methylthiotransferase MtaB